MQAEQQVKRTAAPPKPPRLRRTSAMEDNESEAAVATHTEDGRPNRSSKKKKHLQFQSPVTQRPKETTIYAALQHDSANVDNVSTTAASTASSSTPIARMATVAALAVLKKRLVLGCTSLMYACQHGNVAAVLEQLRSKPESVHQRDSTNKNALHYCAAQGTRAGDLVAAASIAIAAPELLGSADEDGFTPLHLAVIQGNLAMVNLLLANKADVNAVDNEGHSVVHWATVCGEVESLRSVLAAGANVAIPDINGGSPLHYAAQMCGASYEGKLGQTNSSKLALEILGILLAHPQASVDVQDKDGRQPLLWAASAGSAKAVIALVKAGARVESADKDGLTALHCAASRGHTECIDTLISLCGAPTDLIDSNGCTALHYAVTLGHADATSRLLDLEADPNRQDRKGRTPAHCGCSKGQFETVKLLKERGANLWLRNAKGDLPVHEAASSGRRELVEWLLEQRSKQVNTTSNDGRSLLHIAATNDFTDMCKMLLDYGADVNAIYRNSKGVVITPLDCALQRGNRSTAKFLQSNGGLPAVKLRLAARRSNPFQEVSTEVVRPLKYAEKEEYHDLENSKKYVVYLKRSDSDGGGEASCSCTERTYKKEQRFAHTCRRHRRSLKQQLRRRTSSCGEPKEPCQGQGCTDICRSKSNIELGRLKSRERHASSSASDAGEDSCENCCYHKRQKQRVLRRRSVSMRRSKELKDSDQEERGEQSGKETTPRKREKRSGNALPADENMNVKLEQERPASAARRPSSKASSTRSRPQSAMKRQTPPASAGKEATFIKSSAESAQTAQGKEEAKMETHAVELTDEEEQLEKAAEKVVTQVDVHREDEDSSLKLLQEAGPDASETIVDSNAHAAHETEDQEAEVTEQISKEVDQMLHIAATAVASESKAAAEGLPQAEEAPKVTKATEAGSAKEAATDALEKSAESAESALKPEMDHISVAPAATNAASDGPAKAPPNLIETPATPLPTPIPTPLPSPNTESSAQTAQKDAAKAEKSPTTTTDPSTAVNSESSSSQDAAAAAAQNAAAAAVTTASEDATPQQRGQESRRSFTLLPSDSAEDEEVEQTVRKSSFQVLKSDESVGELEDVPHSEEVDFSDSQVFKIVHDAQAAKSASDAELSSAEGDAAHALYDEDEHEDEGRDAVRRYKSSGNRHGVPHAEDAVTVAVDAVSGAYDYNNGRKRRLKKRVRSGTKTRSSSWKSPHEAREAVADSAAQQCNKDQDSGFEPSPRNSKSKIPTPRHIYTAHVARRPIYATLDGRSCSSRLENRKPGDKGACDMNAVTRSIQRNIRRYYMERKIFQHLLELKSLQIRSNKQNEAVLVKRAVDDYHKSCAALGGETGSRLRRYTFSEYTFKNFELFLYETLKTLQKPGTYNFQNINEVYEEAERRLSPDYNAYEKALQCTTKTHRCLHAAHAYTGIPCAAYIPMMNHHTMPKFGFGAYKKTGVGSFYLPKILTSGTGCSSKVALELSHGKSKQLISLPSDKLDSNKRYYVTFTVKEPGAGGGASGNGGASVAMDKEQSEAVAGANAAGGGSGGAATK